MKKLLIILLAFSMSYALNPFSWYWSINLEGDTATVGKWKNNNDSVLVWSNKVCDTLNTVVPRWNYFSNHDSTFKWMNIDTIGGRVKIDTIDVDYLISGEIDLDTLESLVIDTIYGPVQLDTVASDLYLEQTLTVKADDPVTTGLIINSSGYPDYWHNIFMPYSRYESGWLGYGVMLGPDKIGGSSGIGAFQIAFSDTCVSASGHSIDTLDYTDIITFMRDKHIYFSDSMYFGTPTNREIIRFLDDSIIVNGTFDMSGNVHTTNISCSKVNASDSMATNKLYVGSTVLDGDQITVNGTDYFGYKDTTINDSLYEGATLRATATMSLIVVGNIVIAKQLTSLNYGSLTGASQVILKGIPSEYAPLGGMYIPAVIADNASTLAGFLQWNNPDYSLRLYDGSYPSGSGGLPICTITWIR